MLSMIILIILMIILMILMIILMMIYENYESYRTVSFDVPPQEILTKDSVTVAVDAVVYYKVFSA